jgi:hypothetical protein
MKLSDVMSAMDLAAYAEVGLLLFFGAFALVAIDLYRKGPRLEHLARLPIENDAESRRDDQEERP